MTLGTALLIIAVLYLIDRHNLWKRVGQVVGGLAVLAVLTAGGWYGVAEYRTWHLNHARTYLYRQTPCLRCPY